MPLDPQVQILLDQLAAIQVPEFHTLSVPDARAAMHAWAGMRGDLEAVAAVTDRKIPGAAGDIAVRVYTPAGSGPFPGLVYFHGGGWVLGGLDTHDNVCRSLANAAACVVVAVDYRLAPEHAFPAAAEDAYAATAWVAQYAGDIGVLPARIAVGGDSAGGNLAAVVALMARDRGGPRLVHQLLIYPVTDAGCDTPSYRDNAQGYLLSRDSMLWFWNHYAPVAADRQHPYASPLRAERLHGLPPALVITAGFDPLRDEGEAYAARLRAAGVPVRLSRYEGMIHGFFSMSAVLDKAGVALQDAATSLRAAFQNGAMPQGPAPS